MTIKKLLLFLLLAFSHSGFSADIKDLFSAAIFGKTERVKFLLSEGVDVNAKTATGRTAMMAACFNGNIRVVRTLLAYGADVNIADKLASTALMDAVVFGSEELVKLLITSGADVNAQDKQAISVLDKAKKTKYANIVKILEKAIAANEAAKQKMEADAVDGSENSEQAAEDSDGKKTETTKDKE
mgnify:FL=1